MVRRLFVAGLLFLLVRGGAGQGAPRWSVAEAQRRLLQMPVLEMETDVPTGVRAGIGELKSALGRETDAVMVSVPTGTSAAEVQRALEARLPSRTVGATSDGEVRKDADADRGDSKPIAGLYGGELRVAVSAPRAGLLLVRESFGIACGDDTVLLGYAAQDGGWRRVLLWQSGPYDQISGAFGDVYETLLLRAQRAERPLLLVVHGTPWCTSTVSEFAMDVLEVGGSGTPVWHGEHGYRRADDDPPLRVRATADGWEVRASVNSFSEGDRVAREGVMRYAVRDGAVRREEPLAMNARESVEEWMGMPRAEAAEFADEVLPTSETWRMFEEFTYLGKSEEQQAATPTASLGAVRACGDSAAHFQVEVASEVYDRVAKRSRRGPTYFVEMREVSGGYRVHLVLTAADPACGGPDLMAGRRREVR